MICENFFCIYEENGKCVLNENNIELDIAGRCTACIYPNLNEEILKQAKNQLLEKYEKNI